MKSFKKLLVAALLTVATMSGATFAHADLGVDFSAVASNTGTKTDFGSDINIIGWAFTVNKNIDITALAYFDYNGISMAGNHDVALYKSNGDLVASTTVTANDPLAGTSKWRFHDITKTTLTTGNYVIAATVGNDLYTIDPASILWHKNITFTGDVFDSSNTSLPATWLSTESAGVTGGFGPNFVATPVPAAMYLFGSGLIGLVGIRRRNK